MHHRLDVVRRLDHRGLNDGGLRGMRDQMDNVLGAVLQYRQARGLRCQDVCGELGTVVLLLLS